MQIVFMRHSEPDYSFFDKGHILDRGEIWLN